MTIRAVAVFCGSQSGNDPYFVQQARDLGKLLAVKNIRLVYGGGNVGLMGAVANAVLSNGGEVIGVIPEVLVKRERSHKGLTQLLVVADMHIRKRKMYELSDAALILPGGYGTMDEFFEMITWNGLSIHDKQIFVLNNHGYYDQLLLHIQKMYGEGFLYEDPSIRLVVMKKVMDLNRFF